jgi:GNAT superfamily N-acetyltransferase
MSVLAEAIAFERAIRVRAAQRVVGFEHGIAILHDGIPTKSHLNAVLLDSPLSAELGVDELDRIAGEFLSDRGHHHLVLDDGDAAERLAPAMAAAGWSVQRVLYMRWRRASDRPPRPAVARRIDEQTLRQLQLRTALEERDGTGPVERALSETLVAGEAALRAGTHAVGFGAGEGAELSASATLFLDRPEGRGGIAMIEEVGTLSAARGRGLGRAVVAAALGAARDAACDPIIIPADAADWPQELYTRMGFDPLGMQVSFSHPAPAPVARISRR